MGWLFQIFLGNPSLARRLTRSFRWITARIILNDISLNFPRLGSLPNHLSLSRGDHSYNFYRLGDKGLASQPLPLNGDKKARP